MRNSSFLDVHGPIKTIFAVGSEAFISFAASTMGEGLCEMYLASVGKFFSMNMTNDGQQDVVSSPFSLNSFASCHSVMSAPRAASTT